MISAGGSFTGKLMLLLLLCIAGAKLCAQPQIGITARLSEDSTLARCGYAFIVETVGNTVSPEIPDAQFEEKLTLMKDLQTPVYALNVFIPAELKLVGPDVSETALLAYTRKVLERCQLAGIRLIVWGSGGARRIPEGYPVKKAKREFIQLARKVAAQAAQYDVTLALENLNTQETNFINTVAEALQVVKQVNHSNFRLCADIYHMLRENEPAAVLLKTKGYLVHCDIAEKENRTPPGVAQDDFTDYLQALKQTGYSGKIVLECRWNNLVEQAGPAQVYLQQQIKQVWK
ncbi:MAG: sugar phosphate isomerase/epimerase [Cyclobacteriaceae bacterium]|nr:sugar phosphate isomerase/epimerase [Cyclobacteriaceae bacterium]